VQRRFRLTRSTDFKRVRRSGKSYAHPLIVLASLPGETEALHIGVTAGRSVGNAVHRNRAKRLLRAALQPFLNDMILGWDVVLVARQPLAEATFQQTCAALAVLLKRAHLLKVSHDE